MANCTVMLLRAKLDSVTNFFNQFSELANCHLVNFITDDLWESCIPCNVRSEIHRIGLTSAFNFFWNSTEHIAGDSTSCVPGLIQYLTEAKKMSSGTLHDICMPHSALKSKLISWGSRTPILPQLNQFMSPKKAHEVEVMGELVATLARTSDVSHIVDVGSGKGYLTSMLALHHGLKVLGVDSSFINTHGAAKRTQKLQKAWRPATKKVEVCPDGKEPILHKNLWKEQIQMETSSSQYQKSSNSEEYMCSGPVFALYKQSTAYVSENTNLSALVEENFTGQDPCTCILLTGLHTCGDLAPSCLRLFVSDDTVSAVCNVGCCHHLLEEQYCENSFLKKYLGNGAQKPNPGFPMSQFLLEKKFALGRNARMLSAQSVQRILMKREVPNESLWYRALLQVLLMEKCRDKLPEGQVGRIAAKCHSFPEYVSKALTKLGVTFEVTSDEIENLLKNYQLYQQKLLVFFMLRATLAPVIETVILLDRLLYLHEQGIADAHLVQLFDPVISPRCFALLALKHKTQAN